uniref:C-type lectin domain-containing protein n=1 Tax=Salarias fasciatus TaxID=181472 RepID=A0A672HWX6_SALFA
MSFSLYFKMCNVCSDCQCQNYYTFFTFHLCLCVCLYRCVGVSFGLLCILQVVLNISLRLSLAFQCFYHIDNMLMFKKDIPSCTSCSLSLFQKGWVHFRSSFYYISSTEKTWQESRDDCVSRGADLMIIDSQEEQDFTRRFSKDMWIGLTDRAQEGTWRWVDGTLLQRSYWDNGAPNDMSGEEDCAEIIDEDVENSWNDWPCDRQIHWICEKKMAP